MTNKNNSAVPTKFPVVSMNDVFNQMRTRADRWRKEKRVGSVSFDAEFDAVTFHYDGQTEKYRYYIYLSRIKTPAEQMRWLNHLRHKNWFTKEVFNDFMSVLEHLKMLEEKTLADEHEKQLRPRDVLKRRLQEISDHF